MRRKEEEWRGRGGGESERWKARRGVPFMVSEVQRLYMAAISDGGI